MRRLSERQFISLCSVQVQTRSGRDLLGAQKSVPWNRVVKRWNTYGRNKRWRVQQTEFLGTGKTFFLGISKKNNRTLISGTRQQGRNVTWVQKQDTYLMVLGTDTITAKPSSGFRETDFSRNIRVLSCYKHQGFKSNCPRDCLKFVKND